MICEKKNISLCSVILYRSFRTQSATKHEVILPEKSFAVATSLIFNNFFFNFTDKFQPATLIYSLIFFFFINQLLSVDAGVRWRVEYVETSHINTNKDIDRLISETETTVTTDLEGGDRQKAMKRLRVPPLGEQQSPWTTFKVGLFSGSFIVLFLVVVLSGKSVLRHASRANDADRRLLTVNQFRVTYRSLSSEC